jgi:hypothetical protein
LFLLLGVGKGGRWLKERGDGGSVVRC